MVDKGDDAPDFTAPLANGDIESLTLSEEPADAPLVLAFFPGAFTRVCTNEMCAFRDQLSEFDDIGATVYGLSRDTPFTLNEFRSQNDINFGLVSDLNGEIIESYDIAMDFVESGVYGVAKRAVFVVDDSGEITYAWISDNPGVEPDYDEVATAAAEAADSGSN
ncbi:redoxin domain-containing protein [Natronoarchaeum sp. GCM10025703]|uniref:redoxin domain-containing protein n=1 Tax=Natronoarchaeum sp. GCM10025703 TaxID=3252685 RepID=UPI0036158312